MYVTYSKNIKMPYVVNDRVVQPGMLMLEDQVIKFNTVTNNNNVSLILRDITGLEHNLKINDYLIVQNYTLLDSSDYIIDNDKVFITKRFAKPVKIRIQVVYFEDQKYIGTYNDPSELPEVSAIGDFAYIGNDIYTYTVSGWVNAGHIVG